ncbi:ABC transporter ATP-binding protein [Aquamicrobium defluvii]|uniref:Amino acid/amide ABC transporter ATP-binding protein 2 (HAAT family) n=1 Tax=Aquamicrobium defluvii TaxID=69279 RepID=A0A011U7D9_9HYPH|nr:ABC transporter ATP-binding protein [Aquamicrobium defluvii]EXL02001.1 histidinol dehydrogenase [Aquamicrobium defluvii]EZQ13557.1 histidinol dehydrogenase [Halopseudomonas bauzanensis]TDR35307.1 amino acid/amide ABC transporter ATP-binding protein 2 (HAAT family) [Aquamicrobium defluvii]
MSETVLSLKNVNGWYGESHVLHGVDLDVSRGEVVSLIGRNGAGRTTILRAIMGLLERREGRIELKGRDVSSAAPHRLARAGLGYCPEERGIFSTLTCEENLLLPPVTRAGSGMIVPLSEIYEMFPNLAERARSPGTRLSGGEQQMLAIARILRTGADILLLDEISEGLAPVIVQTLARVIRELKSRGFTIVMVEQNFRFAAPLADRFFIIEHGRVIDVVQQSDLAQRMDEIRRFLGV